ncbi:enoyl-CoA-hydratase DpgB [Dactylosporangium sp. McL0621]|uniref:enoyl-CoA-hydratase DpgB n=1 Tax=Dactylosporangium sp. McL0621 TaxID=3415678 RepID=UPI003CE92330
MVTALHPTRGTVLTVVVDGARPLTPDAVAVVTTVCARAEDLGGAAVIVLHVTGVPGPGWTAGLTTELVGRWEQALRRLERVPAAVIALATGDCGGPALDALLAADHRIAAGPVRLVLAADGGLAWPGMALHRLARHAPGAAAVRRAALFGGALESADAVALNLVHEMSDDPRAALAAAIGRASAVSGTELAVRRQLALDAPTVGYDEALGTHLAACDRALRVTATA